MNEAGFQIISNGLISMKFIERNIYDFKRAAQFVSQLPYGRNPDKDNLVTVFNDNCGTCSTKHALLKQLADENDFKELRLIIGIFKMNEKNTPLVGPILKQYNLKYIPEAHCYLRYKSELLDYTKENSKPDDLMNDLIEEMEIQPEQINEFKISYHKDFLKQWLLKEGRNLSLNEIWQIREKCIERLAAG